MLGTNRDYKTRDRAAMVNLYVHKTLMDGHIERGMTREAASKKAFEETLAISFKDRRAMFEGRYDGRTK